MTYILPGIIDVKSSGGSVPLFPTPSTGNTAGGEAVTLTGSGFTGATGVLFDASSATSVVVVNDTTITCVTPAHVAGLVDITVSLPGPDQLAVDAFLYVDDAVVTSITPVGGSTLGGKPVTIIGDNFTGVSTVTFDGVPATSVVVVDDETITCVTPAHIAGAVDVIVEGVGGDGTLTDAYTYAVSSRLTQTALLVVLEAIQPTRITQIPLLVVNLPVQGTKITQVPVLVEATPKPIPFPIPIVPNGEVEEVWQYNTAISTSENAKEQRASLRSDPRYGLRFNALITSDEDRREIYQFFFAAGSQLFDYPMYQHSTGLTTAAGVDATRLYFEPARTDMRAGEAIALFDPIVGKTYYAIIATVEADGATLAAPLGVAAAAGWLVCPAPRFALSPGAALGMAALAGEGDVELYPAVSRAVLRPGQAATVLTFDGLTLIDRRPLANSDVVEDFDHNVVARDNSIAPPSLRTNWRTPFISGRRSWSLRRPSDMDYWRDIASRLRGRRGVFLLPSFRHDIPLVAVPDLSAITLLTDNLQLATFWREKSFQYIRIVTTNGVIYRKIKEVLTNYNLNGDPITLTVILGVALGATAGDNVISMVSYVNICRLAKDEITLVHSDVDSEIYMDVRTVNE